MSKTSTIREYFGLREVTVQNVDASIQKMDLADRIESDRAIGIEVELENLSLKKAPWSLWVEKGDGSLRNNGVEYITVPLPARYAPHALFNLLGDSLSQDVCFSPRTSIHVHVNMQDLLTEQVTNIVLLYAAFEKLFYKYTGRGRIKNIYCVPLMDTGLLTGMCTMGINHARASWSKYTGLNICPLAEYGTIEFRHMHGTFDHRKVVVWIRLLTELVDYVRTQKVEDIHRLLLSMDRVTDYQQILHTIFGSDAMYLKYETYEDVRLSVNAMKQAFISNYSVSGTIIKDVSRESAYFTTGN